MQTALQAFKTIGFQYLGHHNFTVSVLPPSGSDRIYGRISANEGTCIGTYNTNIKENDSFIYFTRHFENKQLPVPSILAVNSTLDCYLQTDLGSQSLLELLETQGPTQAIFEYYQKTLYELARMQVLGHEGFDYSKCLTATEFGKEAIMSDLLYFKYYFLDTLKYGYDKQALLTEFENLATYLSHSDYQFFMFRDFQSRNVMMKDGQPFFIDYQGGMLGAPQYDVASLLWQARANLSAPWKANLLTHYMDCLQQVAQVQINRQRFEDQYRGFVLIRLLQVLGAYGFRGLFERKAHFLASIPQALKNLKWFVENQPINLPLPVFNNILHWLVSETVVQQFVSPRADQDHPLTVTIQSFSYLKNGYPMDDSGNGGGFVFDCRGILNPGRQEQYKAQTGLDKEVQDYLLQETRMPDFLNSVFDLVDITVEDYLKRGFHTLTINFGCTGGQHRSVFAAEETARHLRNKYGVKTTITHQNRSNWVKPISI